MSCLFEALDRSITVYGKDHMKIAGCYQAVALAHYDIDDIKKALEYQQNCVRILKLVRRNKTINECIRVLNLFVCAFRT